MGHRRFLDRVFFQGKPATNPSLARTLAAVTGREVWVPPNPGAMGAIGIAQLATAAAGLDAAAGDGARGAQALDLARLSQASVVERREFRCRDRHCQNLCRVESATVAVGDTQTKIVSGGSCPKYDDAGAGGRKLPKDAPNAFRERDELLGASARRGRSRRRRGTGRRGRSRAAAVRPARRRPRRPPVRALPHRHAAVLRRVLRRARGARRGAARRRRDAGRGRPALRRAELVRAGQAAPRSDRRRTRRPLRADVRPRPVRDGGPRALHVSDGAGRAGDGRARPRAPRDRPRASCARRCSRSPATSASDGFRRELHGVARELGASGAFHRAYRAALAAQQRYEEGLVEIGRRTLDFARREDLPVLLVVGETHVLHEPLLGLRRPRAGGAERRPRAAGRLLPRRRRRAAAGPRALGERRAHAAGHGGRGARRRRVPGAGRRLRVRAQLDGRAPLRRPARATTRTPCSRATVTAARPATSPACRPFLHAVRDYREQTVRRGRAVRAEERAAAQRLGATTSRSLTASRPAGTTSTSSATSAARWGGTSPRRCAAAAWTPTTSVRRTRPRCARPRRPARARSACRTS